MNEHIKKLVHQRAWDAGSNILTEQAVEAIIELIVRECAGLCDQAAEENARTFYAVNETQEVGPALVAKGCQVQAEKLSQQIKEHFGVE